MSKVQELSDEELDAFTDYALNLFKASAEESLYANDPQSYAKVHDLLNGNGELEAAAEDGVVALDPDDVGDGEVVRISFTVVRPGERVHLADVYVTSDGMADHLGTVVWFPDTDCWFE